MARIRSVKPELPQDVRLAKLPRTTRYHYILCWTIADDEGLFRCAPRLLLGQLYPHDRDVFEGDVDTMTKELAANGHLRVVETNDGPVAEIVNWHRHQRIDRPSASHLRGVVPTERVLLVENGGQVLSIARSAVHDYATICVVTVNRILSDRLAGSYAPLVATVERETADRWQAAGVPLEVALRVLRDRTNRYNYSRGRQVRSLSYFDAAVAEENARELAEVGPPLAAGDELPVMAQS